MSVPAEAHPPGRSEASPARSLRSRQILIIALLFGGYAACYFCRADLAVATPLLIDALGERGVSHSDAVVHLGSIVSLGVLAYALGKLLLGGLGDLWGGRRSFLLGLAGATIFTVWFGAGSTLPVFTLAWVGNRLTQSVAWAGLIKVSSKWFDYSSYGTIIGILSLSYLVGDWAARKSMTALLEHGFGWRALFFFAAAVAGVFLLANGALLRESRVEAGFPEAQANPLNLYAASESRPASIRELLLPLLRSRAFLLVCLLSLGCTIVRETFNAWTPLYLREHLGYSVSQAASESALFPGLGAISVLLSGWLSDRLGLNGRALLLFLGLLGTAAALLLLMSARGGAGSVLPLVGIGIAAFCLLGPYSYLGGAFALDFGGKRASAVSSGIIDGVGYLGGVLAGDPVGRLRVAYGWSSVFMALAIVSAAAALGAAALYVLGARASASRSHLP
jgi:sugar phosphate permease